jgi:hypothetical protein
MSAPRIALLAAALLCGCAGTPRGSESAGAPGPKSRPLASYASDPFVPVNLYLNANEQAAGETGPLIEYAAQQLRDSGAFVRLDRGVQRWPITIQARYVLEQHVASGWRRFASVATFGLVRIPTASRHWTFRPSSATACRHSPPASASGSSVPRSTACSSGCWPRSRSAS